MICIEVGYWAWRWGCVGLRVGRRVEEVLSLAMRGKRVSASCGRHLLSEYASSWTSILQPTRGLWRRCGDGVERAPTPRYRSYTVSMR